MNQTGNIRNEIFCVVPAFSFLRDRIYVFSDAFVFYGSIYVFQEKDWT